MKIEIEENQFIEFDERARLFFYGPNQKVAHELVRSLKRFANKKSLNDLEEVVYGENGIEIYRNEQRLNAKNIDFHFLQDNFSLYKEVSFDKNSLMTDFLSVLTENVAVTQELEAIKNHLLKIELLFNDEFRQVSNNILSNLTALSFDDLLKNHLFLSYAAENHDFPLEMMDANEFVDEYLALLSKKLEHQPKESWIILVNPESFLTSERLQYLLTGLSVLTEKSGLLKTLIISQKALGLTYCREDIPSTIILMDESCQMPDFNSFRKSIENHYPTSLKLKDDVLIENFYEIVSNIGSKSRVAGKSYQNMLLLKVLNEILGFETPEFSNNFDELSELERLYLNS
ncbi:CRISPR-associated protein Csn2-St [Lactococcus sp.]|uniref:CRISPR-associated protein Csn2-St n=1 Tax=Lactococcus sp. TaxID=44273 RepID=UPI002FC70225